MQARLDEQSVIQANSQFWEQMLAMKLDALPGAEQPRLSAAHLSGSVALSGAWTGVIEVRLASGLAFQATAAMMMQTLDSVVEADALDAIREIANMIAGTIKSSLLHVRSQLGGGARGLLRTVPGGGHSAGSLPSSDRRFDRAGVRAGVRSMTSGSRSGQVHFAVSRAEPA